MLYRGLVCLVLGTLAWGQAASSTSATSAKTPAQTPASTSSAPPASPDSEAKAPAPAEVPPDAAVITLPGLCENPPADKSKASDCKMVVTRAEFEQLLSLVAPNTPPASRRQIANRYAMGLVMEDEARKMGLDKGPKYEQLMRIARMQVMSQELQHSLQEKAADVPDKDIEDYYKKNAAAYDEASLQRVFIPHSKVLEASKEKLSEAAMKRRQDEGEAAMKTEAEALQKRAAAGADLNKLQEEAFQFAGQKAKPPQTSMGKIRRSSLPANQAAVFELKPGEVSQLISDPSGYFVYKMAEKETLSLDKVKEEIHNTLRAQRMQDAMQNVQQSVTPAFNDAYFTVPGAAPAGAPAPGAKPQPKSPPPNHN